MPLPSLSSSWPPQRHPSCLTQPPCSSSATHVELLRRRHTPDVPATYAVDPVALERLTPPRHRAYQRTTAPTRSSFLGGRATAAAAYAAVQCRHAAAPSRTPRHHAGLPQPPRRTAADSPWIDNALIPIVGTNPVRRRTPSRLRRHERRTNPNLSLTRTYVGG